MHRACFYASGLLVDKPADTWINTRGLHRGLLWLGSHNLGRFLSDGPQFTLYAPAPWLKQGRNQIVFFDLLGTPGEAVTSRDGSVTGTVIHQRESQ